MNAGELRLNVDGKCGENGDTCSCQGDNKPPDIKVSKVTDDQIPDATGFVALTHELRNPSGQTFTFNRYMHNSEQLATTSNIPGVTKVSVYYWKGDDNFQNPLLLEIIKDGIVGKDYYHKYSECELKSSGKNPNVWQHITGLTLQDRLDDRNCGRNGVVPLNIQNPEKGTLPDRVGSTCLKDTRKISLFGGLKLLAGSEYIAAIYQVNGGNTKISRVTVGTKHISDIKVPSDPVSQVGLYSYPGVSNVPLMFNFQLQNGEKKWYYSKDKDGTNWEGISDGSILYSDNNQLTDALAKKLDELVCEYHSGVTIDLSSTRTPGENYCCEVHSKERKGRISVEEDYVQVDGQKKTSYYKHEITLGGLRLAAIKYYLNGNTGIRKRIALSTQNFPIGGVDSVYTFYCDQDNPVLIYVNSPGNSSVTGWFKKDSDDNKPWTKVDALGGITPETIKNCTYWNYLVTALESTGCYSHQPCNTSQSLPGLEGETAPPSSLKGVTLQELGPPDPPQALALKQETLPKEPVPGSPLDSPGVGSDSNRAITIGSSVTTGILVTSALVCFAGWKLYNRYKEDPPLPI